MRPKPAQLSVIVVAALAIVAVAAVMLLAGGHPAQPTPQQPPPSRPTAAADTCCRWRPTLLQHPASLRPEPCPGETGNDNTEAAPAVDSGHIALFDVWWNTEELELTNTSCPPTVVHTREEKRDEDGEPTGEYIYSATRTPSSINIEETIIPHPPVTAKKTLNETDYPKDDYRDLWDADDAENPNGDGDRMIWALPACPDSPATTPLCLSFSADLLNDADWDGVIVYHVDHVHQTDIDKQDPRYVLVYDATDDGDVIRWDSSDARHSQMLVTPGGYDRPEVVLHQSRRVPIPRCTSRASLSKIPPSWAAWIL